MHIAGNNFFRSIRKALIFLFCMAMMTILAIGKYTFNMVVEDGKIFLVDPPSFHHRVITWAQKKLKPTVTYTHFMPNRWYLTTNDSRISKSEIISGNLVKGIWPSDAQSGDRIEAQLLYAPTDDDYTLQASVINSDALPTRTIYLPQGLRSWYVAGDGSKFFENDHCPVKACRLTDDPATEFTADAILFRHSVSLKRTTHPGNQVWILNILESPKNTPSYKDISGDVNWTATYRSDSEIVTPYEKFVLYDPSVVQKSQDVDFSRSKSGTSKVAWFVSNCGATNNRLAYAEKLAEHISVDIFGACGSKRCGRPNQESCKNMLSRNYKFYLSFENSNCRDYITEKFWINALQSDVIPIVMGASLTDYNTVAPYHSFIHVDQFGGPEQLADYLKILDANATAYNEYFQWRGTGQFINTHFLCRLCSMLHSNRSRSFYSNLDEWWRGPSICAK